MSSDTPRRPRRTILIVTAAVVVVAALAFGAFAFWFLRDDAPDEVSIDDAAAQVDADTSEPAEPSTTDDGTTDDGTPDAGTSAPDTSTPDTGTTDTGSVAAGSEADAPSGDISGTWDVDTTIGEFSYEDSTGTFVGFRIAEELSGIGSTEAVGRTPAVTGTLVIDGTTITEVAIEADMTAITTNESRRDDNVHGALDTAQFPTATFVLTEPIVLDESALAGEVVSVDAPGELTIHGITQVVTFPLEARLVDQTIVVVGSLDIEFADFDVEVPSAPIVVSADDHGPIELQLFFTR